MAWMEKVESGVLARSAPVSASHHVTSRAPVSVTSCLPKATKRGLAWKDSER